MMNILFGIKIGYCHLGIYIKMDEIELSDKDYRLGLVGAGEMVEL